MHKSMPDQGSDENEILAQLDAFKARDPQYKDGRVWSLVYYLDDKHSEFLKQAYHLKQACPLSPETGL